MTEADPLRTLAETLADTVWISAERGHRVEQLLAVLRASPLVSEYPEGVDAYLSHWFAQGGDAQFGKLDETCATNADGFVAEVLEKVRASPLLQGWRNIKSAPKDGTVMLLWWPFWCPNRPTIGWFGLKGMQQWFAPEALEGDGDPPTHWQPLPPEPIR